MSGSCNLPMKKCKGAISFVVIELYPLSQPLNICWKTHNWYVVFKVQVVTAVPFLVLATVSEYLHVAGHCMRKRRGPKVD